MTQTIYFLCTGNSCRSQMAEGFAKQYLPDWRVESAGMKAHGLNPKAVDAMAEVGIDISAQHSSVIDEALLQQATLVVTLCDDAAHKCPVVPAHVTRVHWGFDDPAKATGSEAAQWRVFQQVRNAIQRRIQQFAETAR